MRRTLRLGSATREDWRAAENVDITGYTWVASRTRNAPWIQFQAVDYSRATARGKPFWYGEAQSGPWMQPRPGRPRDDGRIRGASLTRAGALCSTAHCLGHLADWGWTDPLRRNHQAPHRPLVQRRSSEDPPGF